MTQSVHKKLVARKAGNLVKPPVVDSVIFVVRGERVILDADLASIYGVSTKRLNEQIKRNKDRFPDDFCFRLTPEELGLIRSKIAAASTSPTRIRSQIATASKRNVRFLPQAFTEHGAISKQLSISSRKSRS